MQRATKTQNALRAMARWITAAAVIVAPWLFGCSDPWAFLMISGVIYLALLIWVLSLLVGAERSVRAPMLSLALLALIGFVALQNASLPTRVVRILNPYSVEVAAKTQQVFDQIKIWHLLRGAPEAPHAVPSTLSLSPAGTQRSLFLLIAYVGVFFVLANTCRHWHELRHVAAAIVGAGFVMALVGVIHKFSGSSEILWFHTPHYGGSIFGPFTNRNHFAAHANMLFGAAFGLFLSSRHFRDVVLSGQWRGRWAWVSTRQASEMALTLFALMMLAGAVAVSLSRGGMLSLAAAMGVFAVAVVARRGSVAQARSGIAAVALLAIGAALWMGSDPMLERLGSLREVAANPLKDFRAIVTGDTLRIFGTCLGFGTGFGSFRHVYSAFQTPSLRFRWLHAHNDWAQLLAEGGLIGAFLFALAALLWIRSVRSEFADARQRVKLFVIGILVGMGTIAVHSLVDYSLHKPANAILLAALAGMAVAGVYMKPVLTGDHGPEEDQRLREKEEPGGLWVWVTRALALVCVGGVTAVAVLQSRELRGELAFARFRYYERVSETTSDAGELKRAVVNGLNEADLAMAWGQSNPDALVEIADELTRWELKVELGRDLRVSASEKSAQSAALAVCGAPTDYLTWLALARSETSMALWDEAETCLKRSRDLVQHRSEVRMFDVLNMGEEIQIP